MTTTCTPCVVESVSATLLGGHARAARRAARGRARAARASRRSTRGRPRPCSPSQRAQLAPSRRASRARAARTCRRSGRRSARAPGSARAARRQLTRSRAPPARDPTAGASPRRAPLVGPARAPASAAAPRTRMWSMPGPGAEKPHSAPGRSRSVGDRPAVTLKSPASTTTSSGCARRDREPGGAQQLGVRQPLVGRVARAVQVRDEIRAAVRRPRGAPPGRSRRSFAQASRAGAPSPSARACASRKRRGFSVEPVVRERRAARGETRIAFPWPENAERRRPWCELGQPAAEPGRRRHRPDARPRGDVAGGEAAERPRRHLLHAEHVRVVGGREPDHLVEERPPLRRHGVAVEEVPAPDEHTLYATSVRVLLADPPAFTPWYDHELAAALARAGADVELATSRFRFGDVPAPDGYRRSERFYPLSSRLFKRSRARLPLKAVEHLDVLRSLSRRARRRRCTCSGSRCRRPTCTCASASPSVFTAHDLLPRRTASRTRPLAAAARRGSTGSSCTPSAAARRSPSSASTRA